MADPKDQGTNPPTDDPTSLPLKKRAMAEKLLVGSSRAPESDSSSDSYSDSSSDDSSNDGDLMDFSGNESRQQHLEELQKKAYYSVLQAFTTETSTITEKRAQIIERLMKEWQIADETHVSFADKIQKDIVMDDEKEMQIAQAKLLTKPTTSSSTSTPKSGASWGSVNPESLIGKYVSIRSPDKAGFEEYIIKAYDAEENMHRLETTNSNAMEIDDQLRLMNLREIPPEDIMWEAGQKPNFDAPKQPIRRSLF